jgi:DNA-binding XRE family transcriptional regulator
MAADQPPRRVKLRAERIKLAHTQDQLAERIGVATCTYRLWEAGRARPMLRYWPAMADIFGLHPIELARIIDQEPSQLDRHEVPSWLNLYESLVQAAGRLVQVEKDLVPALLQTKAYAAAISRRTPLRVTDDEVVERVGDRLARQAALHRKQNPLELVSLITEHVLRDAVGGPEVMIEQCDYLIKMAKRRNIVLRVLRNDGRATYSRGSFQLLTKQDEDRPFIVVTFAGDGPAYNDRPDKVAEYATIYAYVLTAALSSSESLERIHQLKESYR